MRGAGSHAVGPGEGRVGGVLQSLVCLGAAVSVGGGEDLGDDRLVGGGKISFKLKDMYLIHKRARAKL